MQSEPFINCFVGALKPLGEHLKLLGWSFWEKVTVLSISHCTFPPLLGPAVSCGGFLRRCLIQWKCAILFLPDIALFNLFVRISFWNPPLTPTSINTKKRKNQSGPSDQVFAMFVLAVKAQSIERHFGFCCFVDLPADTFFNWISRNTHFESSFKECCFKVNLCVCRYYLLDVSF